MTSTSQAANTIDSPLKYCRIATSKKVREKKIFATHAIHKPSIKDINRKIDNAERLPEESYQITDFPRGLVLIINNKNFECWTDVADYPRHGTEKDGDDLVKLFVELGFVVHEHINVDSDNMITILRYYSSF